MSSNSLLHSHLRLSTDHTEHRRTSYIDNPCDRVVPVFGAQNDIVTRRKALPHKDVAAAIETVRASSPQPAVKLAFEFLVLTAARSAEVRLSTRDEMDVAGRVWTVPALRMKAKREHRVPLCRPPTKTTQVIH